MESVRLLVGQAGPSDSFEEELSLLDCLKEELGFSNCFEVEPSSPSDSLDCLEEELGPSNSFEGEPRMSNRLLGGGGSSDCQRSE